MTNPYPNYYQPRQQIQQPMVQPQMISYTPPVGLKGYPVASVDEARAANIDFDGSVSFFPDLANRKIYTKQINLDGSLSFNVYEMSAPVKNEKPDNSNYITQTQLEEAIENFKNDLITEFALKSKSKNTANNF